MTNNNTAADKIRTFAAAQPISRLIDAIEAMEDKGINTEAERIAYAVSCATAAKRLGLDARAAAMSPIGPAATFRVATIS